MAFFSSKSVEERLNSFCVLMPGLPLPIFVLSIFVMGTIPLMLVVRNTSSFFFSSFIVIVLNFVLKGLIFRMLALVMPGRMSVFLVQRVSFSNQKMLL